MVRPDLTPEMARAAASACTVAAERKQRILPHLYRRRRQGEFNDLAREIGILRVTARTIAAAIPSEYPAEATEGELRMLAGDR